MKKLQQFLSALDQNNNREWFQINKEWFQEIKDEHAVLVQKLIDDVALFDKNVQLLLPKDCIFRIYRDVRFSKNKSPYKTSLGAVFAKGGRKSKYAGYYLHIEPGNTFVGGGIWRPQPEILKSIRYEIYNFPEDYNTLTTEKVFIKLFGEVSGEKLKRAPKDFPADFEYIDLLKHKSFVVTKSFSDQQVLSKSFYSDIILTFKAMEPFISFLNRGIEDL